MSWDEMQADAWQASDLLVELEWHGVTAILSHGRLALVPSLDSVLEADEAWPLVSDIERAANQLAVIVVAEAIVRAVQEPGSE